MNKPYKRPDFIDQIAADAESELNRRRRPRKSNAALWIIAFLVMTLLAGAAVYREMSSRISGIVSVNSSLVAGELFVVTKGGDPKKGVGVRVYAIPVSAELQKIVAALIEESRVMDREWDAFEKAHPKTIVEDKYEAERNAFIKKRQPRNQRLHDELTRLVVEGAVLRTNTDSDGRFSFEAARGRYILVTSEFKASGTAVSWCKGFAVSGEDQKLTCGPDVAIIGECDFGAHVCAIQTLRAMAENF